MPKKEHDYLKRKAMGLADQLPTNSADAYAVIEHMRAFVRQCEADAAVPLSSSLSPPSDNVTAFPASNSSR